MSGDLVLTQQDRGREVPVSPGQLVELRLPENPTTGMRWQVDSGDGIDIIEDRNDLAGTPSPGAAGERVLRLRLKAAGTRLSLSRRQAWDPTIAPDATFELTLIAR